MRFHIEYECLEEYVVTLNANQSSFLVVSYRSSSPIRGYTQVSLQTPVAFGHHDLV